MEGLEWVLARCPEKGRETSNKSIFALPLEGFELQPLLVYYSFDERYVVLESVVVAHPEPNSV
jgi:hypothetical protein